MKYVSQIHIWALAAALIATTGCSNLPGRKEHQGAVIGGVSGAAVGAAVGGSEHRILGALLGGALGAGGGYLIGANIDKITGKDRDAAERANTQAQTNPATPQEARNASTADLNRDGFVTMDEVVAMDKAGLSDDEILRRLRASGQVFELTDAQEQQLISQGVSRDVVMQMENLNREQRDRIASSDQVIGREPVQTTRPDSNTTIP